MADRSSDGYVMDNIPGEVSAEFVMMMLTIAMFTVTVYVVGRNWVGAHTIASARTAAEHCAEGVFMSTLRVMNFPAVENFTDWDLCIYAMVAATYYRICPIVEKRYNFANYDGCVYGVQFNLVRYDD